MTNMTNEIKVALRGLLKTPGFCVIAIATLALAIGANSAVVSLINALLVRPLPYHDSSKLVLLWDQFKALGLERIPVSTPEYIDLERDFHSCPQIAAFDYRNFNLGGAGNPERISGAVVSPGLFPLLGIEPIVGRTFAREEQGEGHDGVVVISELLWKRRFNSDLYLIGKQLLLNGRNYTVIGVMPASFEFPIPLFGIQGNQFGARVDLWTPIAFTKNELKNRGDRNYSVIARLPDRVSLQQAQLELDGLIANWRHQYPDNYKSGEGFGTKIYPLQEQVVGGMRTGLGILLGAVAFVLLIACANLATMLLARASARERELAIRVALGAGPWRLLRPMLTESVLLALGGGIAGVMLSIWAIEFLKRAGARTIPRLAEVSVDLRVLIVMAGVAIGTGILFGLLPGLASAKPELTEALKEGGRSATASRRHNQMRNGLVVGEIALALVLLVGAALLIKSYARLQNVNPGLNPHNVLTIEISLPSLKYPPPETFFYLGTENTIRFFEEATRRVAKLPGVEASAATSLLPLSGSNNDSSFAIEGRENVTGSPMPDEEIRTITPDYFRVLQIHLLQGRCFTDADTAMSPLVVIVSQTLARKYFPNGDALGKRITLDDPRRNPKWATIVGIVGDIRHRGLAVDPEPEYYVPHSQMPLRSMVLAVRSSQDPRSLASAIRREIESIDPDEPIANVRTLDAVVSDSVAPRRFAVVLLGVFAGIALLLAAVGVYGVMSYLVVQRTHEIGVRMALGAQRREVLGLVVGHAGKLVAIGTILGLILTVLSTRALSALLYSVGAFDPVTVAFVTLVLGSIALLASYIPAIRATRADPVIALTHNT
jgi:putative ABC transport system permease protein